MSAIWGILNSNKDSNPAESSKEMAGILMPFGLDDHKTKSLGSLVFGQHQTYITEESKKEELPYYDPQSKLLITADVRLDNRSELCSALNIPQNQQSSIPDSQIIIKAYQKWGIKCSAHLLGAYAFSIWDERNQLLFSSRDHMGFRPFFYYSDTYRFVFSSDIRALLAVPEIPKRIDEAYLSAYLLSNFFTHLEHTFYKNILKLPPAHSMTLTNGKLDIFRYWFPEDSPKVRLKTDQAYGEEIADLLHKAVSSRLRSSYQMGAHFSGGLDSCSVGVIAARMLKQKNKTITLFSWSPPLGEPGRYYENDERRRIDIVCAKESLDCQYSHSDAVKINSLLMRDVSTEPTIMLYLEQEIQELASQQGIRVLLSGWGGDELISFNGRGFFSEMLLRGKFRTLVKELSRSQSAPGIKKFLGSFYNSVMVPFFPDPILTLLKYRNTDDIIAPPTYIEMKTVKDIAKKSGLLRESSRPGPFVRKNQLRLLNDGHLTNRIESWFLSGAPLGIEYRYPLLDRRLLEVALGLPAEQFRKNGFSRFAFRNALEGILPPEVQWDRVKHEPGYQDRRINPGQREDIQPPLSRKKKVGKPIFSWIDADKINEMISPDFKGNKNERGLRSIVYLRALWKE